LTLFRRHFFLIFAIAVILLMAVVAGYKIIGPNSKLKKGDGGPPGAAAKGPGGPGGGAAAGPGGGRGPGGPSGGRGGGRGGMTVTPYAIASRSFTDRIEVLGVAKGRESVTLTSNNSEMVTAVRFRVGQDVRQGQVLVELKTNEEDAQILQAQSAVSIAKLEADRWTALAERGVAPRQQAEQFQAAYRSAQANLAAVEARRGDRVIRAPFSGVIGFSDIAPGALISPGTAIATLDDVSVIRVDFDVPDRYLPVLRRGTPVLAKNDSYPDQIYSGVIADVDTRIDERTRSVKARAEFRNPNRLMKPGMLMRVSIERGVRQALAAPEAAVQFNGPQAFVYLIGRRGPAAVAQQRPIVSGIIEKGFVEVKDGLAAGDQIVADGLNRIQPGMTITVGRGGAPGAGRPGVGGEEAGRPGMGAAPQGAGRPGGPPGAGMKSGGMTKEGQRQ